MSDAGRQALAPTAPPSHALEERTKLGGTDTEDIRPYQRLRRAAFAALMGLLPVLPLLVAVPASGATFSCDQTLSVETVEPSLADRLRSIAPARATFCKGIMLSGEIADGDAEKLEDLIQANIPVIDVLDLNSRGGSVGEALRLGRIARKYLLTTEAPSSNGSYLHSYPVRVPGASCLSACFFVWIGGVNRGGDVVGIHRPTPPSTELQRLSPIEADQLYHALADNVQAYLAEMDVSEHWFADMMKIPSDEIHMVQVSGYVGR